MRACGGVDPRNRCVERRLAIIVSGRKPQGERKVEWPYEQRIDPLDCGNFFDRFKRCRGLDHGYNADPLIRCTDIARAIPRADPDRAEAAPAGWRIAARADQFACILDAIDHGGNDRHGTRIEHSADYAGFVPRNTNNRRGSRQIDCADHVHRRFIVHAAMLHVDQHPVETALGKDFSCKRARDHEPGTQRYFTPAPSFLDLHWSPLLLDRF